MIWDENKLKHTQIKKGFRIRGLHMTRLETYSDAAFAFAATLLIISFGSIPESYDELILALKDIPAFAASFTSITFLWASHRKWSQRYGLEDQKSIFISLFIVFVMLVYVYPLKMIFSALFAWVSNGWLPTLFVLNSKQELVHLFIIYGLGYAILMFMFVLLYQHAIKLSVQLSLNPLEHLRTQGEVSSFLILTFSGIASALFAWIMPVDIGVFAGFIYLSLPIAMPFVAIYYAKKIENLKR